MNPTAFLDNPKNFPKGWAQKDAIEIYNYQQEYLENLPKNAIMSADVGLGKTIMALEHARRHGVNHLIVVAPASKVRTGDWQREIVRFFTQEDTWIDEDGDAVTRWDKTSIPAYEVISYEMFTKRHAEFMSPDVTLIIDESHFICNATAKRSKAVLKVAKQAHQWIMLSATPLPNGWKSAATYAILTGLSRNKTDFVRRFEIWDRSRGFPLLMGYRETQTLEKWWATVAKPLERTGDMVLPSEDIAITTPMTGKVLSAYKRAVKERLYGEEMLDSPSKLFATLRQIPTMTRIDALQSIVESTDEHIVVFYNFNVERDAMLAMLQKNFKERTIYEQSGHRSDLPARETWGNLPSSVTLVQYQSGSQAIELTYASVTVYLSPTASYANYEQSKGRTRRNGQAKTTLFYHISAEGSLDKHIYQLLENKKDFSIDLLEKLLLT